MLRTAKVLAAMLLMLQALTPPSALAEESSPQGRYFGMRHGESMPSFEQRICSSMAAGIDPRNGLTARGREESLAASRAWIAEHGAAIQAAWQRGDLVILSSPFSRSRETAEILVASLQSWLASAPIATSPTPALAIRIEADLRERDFGQFEGLSPSGPIYRKIWDQDARNPSSSSEGVESAEAVQRRVAALIARLERQAAANPGRISVLVSHGDTLKILQTSAQGQSAAAHQDPSQVTPFETGEIRALLWQGRP
ncbi:MAG: histidine phosphatase family protein [Prochlorococcaceae cyanobacterium]